MSLAGVLRNARARAAGARGLVLAHHRVAAEQGDREHELVPALSLQQFEERLDLVASNYSVVPGSEITAAVSGARPGALPPLALTFDDDLASHLDVVAPALRRKGLSATFFVNPPLPAGSSFWWEDLQELVDGGRLPARLESLPEADLSGPRQREPKAIHVLGQTIESLPPGRRDAVAAELHALAGARTRPRLDAGGMKALVDDGLELGFHTSRHYLLTTLDDGDLQRELTEGRDTLEQIAGKPVTTIAYPHGKADARVAKAARTAGFTLAFTGTKGPVKRGTNPFLLPRVEVHALPLTEFEGRLAWALAGARQ